MLIKASTEKKDERKIGESKKYKENSDWSKSPLGKYSSDKKLGFRKGESAFPTEVEMSRHIHS